MNYNREILSIYKCGRAGIQGGPRPKETVVVFVIFTTALHMAISLLHKTLNLSLDMLLSE